MKTLSSKQWEAVINHLREEIIEYGALFNLFQEQQDHIFSRNTEALLKTSEEIDLQTDQMKALCKEREQLILKLAKEMGNSQAEARLRDLLPHFPQEVSLLFSTLIEEMYAIIDKIQRKANQNQHLLYRACDLTEQLIAQLRPDLKEKTYNQQGKLNVLKPHLNIGITG